MVTKTSHSTLSGRALSSSLNRQDAKAAADFHSGSATALARTFAMRTVHDGKEEN